MQESLPQKGSAGGVWTRDSTPAEAAEGTSARKAIKQTMAMAIRKNQKYGLDMDMGQVSALGDMLLYDMEGYGISIPIFQKRFPKKREDERLFQMQVDSDDGNVLGIGHHSLYLRLDPMIRACLDDHVYSESG